MNNKRRYLTDIDLESVSRVINLPDPVSPGDAVNKSFLETELAKVSGVSELGDLLDVNTNSKVEKSVLYYSSSAGKFLADNIETTITLTDGGNF